MIDLNTKTAILMLYRLNHSQRSIARELKIDRKTVGRCIKRDRELNERLEQAEDGSAEQRELMGLIAGKPVYNNGKKMKRKRKKLTPEIEKRVDEILEDEKRKDQTYGAEHKLKKTSKMIHEMLLEEGFDISYTTINNLVKKKRNKYKEVFIKQYYDFADRGEFDFGERNITIDGKKQKVFIAVMVLPASGYRDFYVYKNSQMDVFVDAQVRFFERIGGVPLDMVYDNMKNVVARFVGRNERELTETVQNLANYYHFTIVLTNPYKGNEKGTVEASVKTVARDLFARKDQFKSFEELIDYVRERKEILNKGIDLKAEQECLQEYRAPYQSAQISVHRVSKYSFVRFEKNDYSVPEEYSGANVTVKRYPLAIEIYHEGELIAQHSRLMGEEEYSIELEHYYKTLLRKPGALANSLALRQATQLKKIFREYYTENPREFLEKLIDGKDVLDVDELAQSLIPENSFKPEENELENRSIKQLEEVQSLFTGEQEDEPSD